MQRVMIVGGPGSGKSTLARLLGAHTGLPVHHMDHIHHLPGWKPRPMAEKRSMAHAIERQEAWIFEGGMSSTYASRAARADTLIWLDLPMPLRLWRVLARLVRYYGQRRPDMAEGCTESFGAHTIAFLHWIVTTRRIQRSKIADLVAASPASLEVVHLTRPGQVTGWLSKIDASRPRA
ncbi:DNA topology modulation protein FlaR [Salipiger sp. IMCC34102]|uniref:DNA topology modulation protein FlaR n=1 Tax=Salipiger sp. IMCC34102 TaxID=2510647 RepID=UPI00101D5111|nr:DNA topology modulation protein FlaR [Salipiger sp. IMCC34102]RYH04041.1 DNA topology modulation protein FlaR [Salipiger sp. IMCC34102]